MRLREDRKWVFFVGCLLCGLGVWRVVANFSMGIDSPIDLLHEPESWYWFHAVGCCVCRALSEKPNYECDLSCKGFTGRGIR